MSDLARILKMKIKIKEPLSVGLDVRLQNTSDLKEEIAVVYEMPTLRKIL